MGPAREKFASEDIVLRASPRESEEKDVPDLKRCRARLDAYLKVYGEEYVLAGLVRPPDGSEVRYNIVAKRVAQNLVDNRQRRETDGLRYYFIYDRVWLDKKIAALEGRSGHKDPGDPDNRTEPEYRPPEEKRPDVVTKRADIDSIIDDIMSKTGSPRSA